MNKRLNEKQYAAIEYLAQPKRGGMTYDEIAQEVGVTRQALHKWRNDDVFNEELKTQVVKRTAERLPDVLDSVPKHIIDSGNAAMLRTFLQMHGLLTEKTEVTTREDKHTDNEAIRSEIERFKQRRKAAE